MGIKLWPHMENEKHPSENMIHNEGCPSVTPYLLEGPARFPIIVICPGGGYGMRAEHEGEPVARWLNRIGVSAVVLNYRVMPYRHPVPLRDAHRAIRLVRHHATEWNLDSSRVGILGFSAGGHLASTAGTRYDSGNPHHTDPVERESSRPDLMVLCYPVITMGELTHEGSRSCLLGERQHDPDFIRLLSNEKQITADTPPVFLWHTVDDEDVPVENAMMFAEGLRDNNVPLDLHLYESGRHGLGLAEQHAEAGSWTMLCEAWLRRRKFIL